MDWQHVVEIQQVTNGYFRALDEKDFDETDLQRIFTADAKLVRPNGAATLGPKAIGESHRESMARFENTQHLLTGHEVTLDGETATLRANVVAMHIWPGANTMVNAQESHFVAGGVVTARLIHTSAGWRITEIANCVLWRAGGGFERIFATK
jgi:hypothetical protein